MLLPGGIPSWDPFARDEEAAPPAPPPGPEAPPGSDAELVHTGDGRYTLTDHGSDEVLTFLSNGYLTSDADRNGNTIGFHYNSNNNLSSMVDTQARTTSFAYTGNYISQITDPANRLYQYAYDANNRLQSYTDPNGHTTQYQYNTNNLLTQITDPAGNITRFTYDSSYRVTSLTRVTDNTSGAGYTWSFSYSGSTVTVTDPNQHSAVYTHDSADRITSVKTASGNTWQTSWTADNHTASLTKPSGATTRYTYDSRNNLTQISYPGGAHESWAYADSQNPYLPTSHTDTQGNTTNTGYTATGLPSIVTDGAGRTKSYAYNSNGTVSVMTDGNGHAMYYSYNNLGLLSEERPPCPDGTARPTSASTCSSGTAPYGAHSFTYDAANRKASESDGNGLTTGYAYDANGNLLVSTAPDGSQHTMNYDADDHQASSSATGPGGVPTTEAVVNGGFESGTNPWQGAGGEIGIGGDVSGAHSGQNDAHFQAYQSGW